MVALLAATPEPAVGAAGDGVAACTAALVAPVAGARVVLTAVGVAAAGWLVAPDVPVVAVGVAARLEAWVAAAVGVAVIVGVALAVAVDVVVAVDAGVGVVVAVSALDGAVLEAVATAGWVTTGIVVGAGGGAVG